MFEDIRDAEDALHYLDGTSVHGRELEIQYAEGDRKSESTMVHSVQRALNSAYSVKLLTR